MQNAATHRGKGITMKTYSTVAAAQKIGIGLRTLNRWLSLGRIRSSVSLPISNGRTLWRWTDADIRTDRRIKATLKPGRKPRGAR